MPKDFNKLVELTEALIQSERLAETQKNNLDYVLANTSDGYWDWNMKTNHEYMSPRFWEILGQDHTTKKHHPDEWISLMHPDDLKVAYDTLEKHIKSKGKLPYLQEVRYFKPDGSIVWILCKGKIIEWDGDEPLRMIGTHSDITPLKEGADE